MTVAELKKLREHVDQRADLIIGDRVSIRGSRRHLKFVQRLGNRLCCWCIWFGWGRRFQDMGSLRLIRRTALELLNLQDRGFGWNVEMQVRAIEHGLQVLEFPVGYDPRRAGKSKISGNLLGTCAASAGIVKMLARLWFARKRRGRNAEAA